MKTLCLSALSLAAAMAVACNANRNDMTDRQMTNGLTDAEKRAGILTPEVMLKIARVGESDLAFSPDGGRILYTLTTCDVEKNSCATSLWTVTPGGAERRLTGTAPGGGTGSTPPPRSGSRQKEIPATASASVAPPAIGSGAGGSGSGTPAATASPNAPGSGSSASPAPPASAGTGTPAAPSTPAPGTASAPAVSDTNPRWLPDGRVMFISDRSGAPRLWMMDSDGRKPIQIAGVDSDVESFGVDPTGRHIFVVRKVKVEKHLSADIFPDLPLSRARVYDDLMARHWSYWNDGSFSHIFVGELSDKRVTGLRDIMEGEGWDSPLAPYFDASEIAWNHDGTQLAYTCKKLTGAAYAVSTDSDIFLYDVAGGTTKNLTKGMPGYEKYPRFSPDGRRVAFTSMARAGNESDKARLMVLDLVSGAMTDLTADFDYSAENITWAVDGRIYFTAAVEGTVRLFSVDPDGKNGGREYPYSCQDDGIVPLTPGDADIVGYAVSGRDPSKIVVARQSISRPTELYLLVGGTISSDAPAGSVASPRGGVGGGEPAPPVSAPGQNLILLTHHNDEIYSNITMGRVDKRWVMTTDSRLMLTWVIYPPGFDSTKKYPVLLYCQGGPQSTVSQFWSYRWNFQLMAAHGYVVVAPNRRGVPSFGQPWLDQISGDYAGQNIRDYLSAIDDVAREPWADRSRMGCVGASYGGYSVFYLAGHHGGRFKAFIAHCGIFNLESMYGQTEELWFVNRDYGGPYWDMNNATAQRTYANSPHKAVARWDTPILIVTGEQDYRIPYAQSLEAFTAARLRGIPARLVVFADEGHWVTKPQNSLAWNREFFGWLDKYLK